MLSLITIRFFPIRFGLSSQSQKFYAREIPESAARFSELIYLLPERYPAQKYAFPPAQFELLPTSQNLTQKVWSSSK